MAIGSEVIAIGRNRADHARTCRSRNMGVSIMSLFMRGTKLGIRRCGGGLVVGMLCAVMGAAAPIAGESRDDHVSHPVNAESESHEATCREEFKSLEQALLFAMAYKTLTDQGLADGMPSPDLKELELRLMLLMIDCQSEVTDVRVLYSLAELSTLTDSWRSAWVLARVTVERAEELHHTLPHDTREHRVIHFCGVRSLGIMLQSALEMGEPSLVRDALVAIDTTPLRNATWNSLTFINRNFVRGQLHSGSASRLTYIADRLSMMDEMIQDEFETLREPWDNAMKLLATQIAEHAVAQGVEVGGEESPIEILYLLARLEMLDSE